MEGKSPLQDLNATDQGILVCHIPKAGQVQEIRLCWRNFFFQTPYPKAENTNEIHWWLFLPKMAVILFMSAFSPASPRKAILVTYCFNRAFARWHHLTTTTRIFQFVLFWCKLGSLSSKPYWADKNFNKKGEMKWILVVVVKWRYHANVLLSPGEITRSHSTYCTYICRV